MENNPLVAGIVGLTTASCIYIWKSDRFNKSQKTFLLLCFFFPPLQWLAIIITLAYNNHIENNSVEKVAEREIEQQTNTLNSQVENLKNLKIKGILTEEEYIQKTNKIEQEKIEENLKNSQAHKQLKSLFDSGILTKEEFENKVQIVKKQKVYQSNYNQDSQDNKQDTDDLTQSEYTTLDNKIIVKIIKIQSKNYQIFIGDKLITEGKYKISVDDTNINNIEILKFTVNNGITKEIYFIKSYKKIIVEMTNETQLQKGDNIYLKSGDIAPNGVYSTGFMSSKILVENSKFVKYK